MYRWVEEYRTVFWFGLVGIDPVSVVRDLHVDSRKIWGTSNAPGHQTHHGPSSRLSLTYQRWSSISSAGILANLSSRTNLAGVELEPVTHARLTSVESKFEGGVTSELLHQRNINLVLDELKWSRKLILAPACDMAPHSGTIAEMIHNFECDSSFGSCFANKTKCLLGCDKIVRWIKSIWNLTT